MNKELFTKAENFSKRNWKVCFKDGFFGVFARCCNMDEGKEWFEGWAVKKELLKKAGLFSEFRFRVNENTGLMYTLFHDYFRRVGFEGKKKFEISESEDIKVNKDVTDFIESLFDKPFKKKIYLIDDMAFLIYYDEKGLMKAVYLFNYLQG